MKSHQKTRTTHRGQIVDLHSKRMFAGEIEVNQGHITAVRELPSVPASEGFLCPGLIDAHIHIESSMLSPAEFARIAVIHGTVGTVSDPHEIANVLGTDGVRAMQKMASITPCKIHLGIPSCVPATDFESAGATIDAVAIEELCKDPSLIYLAEMMNFPGVVHRDPDVMAKIEIARRYGKPIDGHAPGLRGPDLQTYVAAGITTDHECTCLEEAWEKCSLGQKILIREGSAAKNFDALWPMLIEKPDSCMFCSDDKHPDELIDGHINQLCARARAMNVPVFNILQAACLNPVEHYGLRCGLLRPGDPADFIRLSDLDTFRVLETWIDGKCVAEQGISNLPVTRAPQVNHFKCTVKSPEDFSVAAPATGNQAPTLRVIEAIDGSIITDKCELPALIQNNFVQADPQRDLLKITVVNRYQDNPPAVAFVRGFGIKHGAIASSVAHDCHNIVAVGCDDSSLAEAVNLIIRARGGISAVGKAGPEILPLPLAGLMSDDPAEDVALRYTKLTRRARELGSNLHAPYMTLSFLALLVIPKLKLGDRGLFDSEKFTFTNIFV